MQPPAVHSNTIMSDGTGKLTILSSSSAVAVVVAVEVAVEVAVVVLYLQQ